MAPSEEALQSEWLVDGGELGERIRAMDWSATPLGPRERWPQSLRTVVCMLVESGFPMVLLWSREHRFLYNDAYRIVAAERHPWALGREVRDVWPETWEISRPLLTGVLERGETHFFEDKRFALLRHGALEDAYFSLSYSPVRVEDGAIAGVLVTLQETTPRVRAHRRASEALEESERLLKITERIGRVGSWSWDLGTGTLKWSHGLYLLYGRAPATFTPTLDALLAQTPPEDRPILETTIAGAAKDGRPVEIEHRVVTPDGTLHVLRSRGEIVLRDANGAPLRMAGITQEVTERKQMEDALRASEERLDRALRAARLGVWDWDVTTDAITWNDRMYELYGLTREQFGGDLRAVQSSVHPDDRARFAAEIAASLAGTRTWDIEFRVQRPDGTVRHVKADGLVLRDEHGAPKRMLGLNQDITERREAEEQRDRALQEAAVQRGRMEVMVENDRRKNEFLAMLGHELRNPLAPIRNSLHILDRTLRGGEQARRAQAVIERQLAHLTRLVDDLLDVSRITRGKIALRREWLDLCELVRRTVEDHRAAFADARVELALSAPPAALWVFGDETRLAQVLGNLLQNAVKFTPSGGSTRVAVEADPARTTATVRVTDDGRGIEAELMPRLFEPFTQADTTLDRSKGGLGLGLALVKGLVELHGGCVDAASEGLDRGATFTLTLPIAASPPEEVASGGGSASGPSRRVLIVEDNRDAAASLKELLELDGHRVAVAHTGPEGLALATTFAPEIVLCDIGLPDMNGYEVARRLRADSRYVGVTLVALTGYAGPEDVAKSREVGFDRHLAKPPQLDALEKILREARAG